MPNLTIRYDPLTHEYLNDANNQPVDPAAIDATDVVIIGADPGGAWPGNYTVTLPANFTCALLQISDGCKATLPSGGVLTGDVDILPLSGLTLGTGGSTPAILSGSVLQFGDSILQTNGPASIQGAGKTVSMPAGSVLIVSGGQLNIAASLVFFSQPPAITIASGSTLNVESALAGAQVSVLNGLITGGGTLMYSGPVDIMNGSVDFSPPPPVGSGPVAITLTAPALVQNGTANFGSNVTFQSPTLDNITATGELDIGAGQSVTLKDGFLGTPTVNVAGLLLNITNLSDLTGPVFSIGAPGASVTVQAQGTGAALKLGQITFLGDTTVTDGTPGSDLELTGPFTLAAEATPYTVAIHTFMLTIDPGAIATVQSGATLRTTGLINNDEIDIAGGSVLFDNIRTPGGYGTIRFDDPILPVGATTPTTGTLEFAQPGVAATLTDFDSDDAVDIMRNFGDTHYHLSLTGSTLSVLDSFGTPLGMFSLQSSVGVSYDVSQFRVQGDGGSGALLTAPGILCFVAGTLIATPGGEVPVERLAVGDAVLTLSGKARAIVWVGVGRVLARRGRRDAATPVIVRKGALADNVPHRDLRVTKGHSLYLDGSLIPVEFLVNHRSVLWDDRAHEVAVYHIELATHDVLLAEGAPAESYRDDGNRWLFQNCNSGWANPPKPPCAGILMGGPAVDAIWRRLLDRSGPRPGLPLTDDPDLHLRIDGRRIDAIHRRADKYAFRLPARPGTARICSRAAVPQELGIARDARPLGVAVRRIELAGPTRRRTIEADAATLADGYHAFEPDNGIRWTDGDAAVPAALFAGMTCPCMLMLHLGGRTRYLDEGEAARAA